MRNLLNFLARHHETLFFVLLMAVCVLLMARCTHYGHSAWLTSANAVAGHTYAARTAVSAYFGLRSRNEALQSRNVVLEQQIENLKRTLQQAADSKAPMPALPQADTAAVPMLDAYVIKNSTDKLDNYLTLNRGSADGVCPEMGVVGTEGVVGIVYQTSAHYALVISLLNSKSNLSCKINGSQYFGYLKWEGGDSQYAYLKDLPRHAEFALGDTVVTSGYSAVFPPGIMVGTIDDMQDSHDGLSYLLRVKLATDFGRVGSVRLLQRPGQDEQRQLEQHADPTSQHNR